MAHRSRLAPYTYPPAKLGLKTCLLTATTTSSSFDVRYRSEVSVSVVATRGGAGYTAIAVTFQNSPDNGTTWVDVQSVSVAAGTGTLSDYSASKTTSVTKNFEARLTDLNFKDMRIKVSSTAGASGDVADVWVTVK